MSISTPGGAPERVPSTVSTDKKPGAGKPPAGGGKPGGAKPAGARPANGRPAGAKGGGKGRKPVTPVKMNGSRSWGPIAVVAAVVLLAVGIVGYGVFASMRAPGSWQEQASEISGIVNYRENADKTLTANGHKPGKLPYKVSPPVGGDHNIAFQNCMGDVYDAPIANEHAVHSLEHGAVWVTYKLGMPDNQVAKLREKVENKPFMMISPVEGLSSNVSLQAWGYQLKVDTVDDKRIDEFIRALRQNATMEPNVGCSGGVTQTGTTPRDGAAQPGQ